MDEIDLAQVRDSVMDIIEGSKQSYSYISKIDTHSAFSIIEFPVLFLLLILGDITGYINSNITELSQYLRASDVFIWSTIVTLFLSNIIAKFCKSFFPSGLFLIGQKRDLQNLEELSLGDYIGQVELLSPF